MQTYFIYSIGLKNGKFVVVDVVNWYQIFLTTTFFKNETRVNNNEFRVNNNKFGVKSYFVP